MRIVTSKRYPMDYEPSYPHRARRYVIGLGDEEGTPVLPAPDGANAFPWGKYFFFGIAVGVATHYTIRFLERRK